MVKLTLTFKGRTLQSHSLDAWPFTIGREIANDLQIDSLAVAPRHASIEEVDGAIVVRQLDENFPLIVNGVRTEEHPLKQGDCIGIGKHQLFFSEENDKSAKKPERKAEAQNGAAAKPQASGHLPGEASLQVMRGKNIGLVIPLRRAMTRIGGEESGSAVIAHRKDGYFLSALAAESVKLNGVDILEESVLLRHGDTLKIGTNLLQFFQGKGQEAG